MPLRRLAAVPLALLSLAACSLGARDRPLFELLDPDDTGITFANTITTSDTYNIQTDVYVYNGAGVAVGDVDNDGLPDVFFTGNQVSSRLYRNRGGMRFDDVTEHAGVRTTRWAAGAAMADVNADGWLDIYVVVSGRESSRPADRANLLFINDRDGTFTESAAAYGLADTGFGTHAAFLDYDGDGCVDMFLLNNSPQDFSRASDVATPTGIRGETPGSHNELYRNGCDGTFTNVSERAGILRTAGYGLGVAVADLNADGRPDIYVSNDATPNDVLYVNNGDGTFTDRAGRWLKRASLAGMGVDIADFNDDGWPDILQADMMPRDLATRKRMTGAGTYNAMLEMRNRGYRDDYSMNSLQLSNGVTPEGDVVFSEIARLAGVEATDWSWSALFADFDNDGRKDIFISNGYPKAVNDLDYQVAAFSARRSASTPRARQAGLDVLKQLPKHEEPNFVFRNRGDLTFADATKAWGLDRPSISYGAAYADLDNDGRLDLVVNNIDAPAFVYHNVGPAGDGANHWLAVRLQGDAPNRQGLGAKLILTAGGRTQHLEQTPFRGYMSTMDDRAHFGLGQARRVDSLEVVWPDGRRQLLTGLDVDRVVTVRQADAAARPRTAPPAGRDRPFQPLAATSWGLTYAHATGGTVLDYTIQPLLPYLISRHGPPLAVGDVNGDGLDDVFVGGRAGAPARLFTQRADGTFAESAGRQPWAADSAYEDWGASFLDANGDGRQDLYVASGGYHLAESSALLQDRLYVNAGGGRFVRDSAALPAMRTSTAAVRVGDFNGDGRPDLFVGGRLAPREYPRPTRSYVLRNDAGPNGQARFTDVTATVAPQLARPVGMITDAAWVDFDGDGRLDLVTAGEWMPLGFHRNEPGSGPGQARLVDASAATGLPSTRGSWHSLAVGDFDRDGRPDLVAGNLGLNTYHTSPERPFGIYAADFTGNRTTDVILTQRIDGADYPIAGVRTLGREIFTLDVKYPTAGAFAPATLTEMFGAAALQRAVHYQADTFASLYLRNQGGGRFAAAPLPSLAQIAPIRGSVVDDVDGDGHLDLIVAGNLYDTEPGTPPADAGNGLWLRGDGTGRFVPVPPVASGFLAPGRVSGLALVRTPNGKAVLVANTADSLRAFAFGRRPQLAAGRP